jgi:hypothetical protein
VRASTVQEQGTIKLWASTFLLIDQIQVLRQLPLEQARRRFPTDGFIGRCHFQLSAAEIDAGTYNVVHEVALNVDPRVRFLVEFSELEQHWNGAHFNRYRVSRRVVVDEEGLLAK